MSPSDSNRRSPYQGLLPYAEDDAPFFFGREKETRLIIANLFASPLTILYGASGVGKSSVLRAGVGRQLRTRDGVLAVVSSSWQHDPAAALKAAVAEEAAKLGFNDLHAPQSAPLAEYLAACCKQLNRRLMLILDQFEDYFLYHPDDNPFDDEFAAAVTQTEAPFSLLVAVREDCYAKLDRFEGRIPFLYDNYIRVEHLDRQAARDAIEKPIEQYNLLCLKAGERVSIEAELVEAVLRQVRTGEVVIGEAGRGVGETSRLRSGEEAEIETPYLQLVLTRLWEEETRAGSRRLRLSTLEALGGAEKIVRTHLDAVMGTLDPREQEVAARVFHYLVTPSGTKVGYSASDLAASAELDAASVTGILDKLSYGHLRILRPVDPLWNRPEAARYEIFHDVLAPAVLDWRSRYVRLETERRLEREKAEAQLQAVEQRRRAEVQARVARRFRMLAGALLLMFLLSLGAVAYAFSQRQQALSSERRAVENEGMARTAAEVAERHAELAREKTTAAQISEEQAGAARSAAEDERARAEQEARSAALRAAEAVEAKSKESAARREAEAALNQVNVRRIVATASVDAFTLILSGRKQDALQRLRESEALIGQINNVNEQASARLGLGGTFTVLDDEQKSLQNFRAALEGFRAAGNRSGELMALLVIAAKRKGAGEWQKALENYEELLLLTRAAGLGEEEQADVLDEIAEIHLNLNQWEKALDYYGQAAALQRKAGKHSSEADAVESAAAIHKARGNKEQALKLYLQTSEIRIQAKEFDEAAEASETMGDIFHELGDYKGSIRPYELASELYKKAGFPLREAGALKTVGNKHSELGETRKSLESYEQALAVYRVAGERLKEAEALEAVADKQDYLGETAKALESFEQARVIYHELGERRKEAAVLDRLGNIHRYLNEEPKALDYHERALGAWQAVGDRLWEAATLRYIGKLKGRREALGHLHQALQVFQELKHRPFEADTRADIAHTHAALGESEKALEGFRQAAEIYRQIGNRAQVATMLDSMGQVYDTEGEWRKALDCYEQQLSIVQSLGNRVWEINVLNSIAEDYVRLGETRKGLDLYLDALSLMDSEGLRREEPLVHVRVGRIYETLGDAKAAAEFYGYAEGGKP